MSGQPPTLTTETGTPPSVWARSTTTAAFSRDDPAPALDSSVLPGVQSTQSTHSTVSTPGRDFPGAFPSSYETHSNSDGTFGSINTQALSEAAKNAVHSVTDTASQYIPAAKTIVGTVSSYIPGANGTGTAINGTARASDHDSSHATSMPSSETEGAQPKEHVGGTGALPGVVSEEGVTKLPDERNVRSEAIPTRTNPFSATYPAPPYPATAPSDILLPADAVATAPTKTTTTTTTTAVTDRTSLPSQELLGQQPFTHQDGAGSLPGLKRESGVAALPDETGGPAGATNATSSATGTHARDYGAQPALAHPGDEAGNESLGLGERRAGGNVAGGVGSLVGGKKEEGVAVLPDERGTASTGTGVSAGTKGDKLNEMDQSEREERHEREGTEPEKHKEANATKGAEIKGDGYDTNYHPAQLHPSTKVAPTTPSEATPQGTETNGAEAKHDEAKDSQGGDPAAGAAGGGGDKVKKAGFLDKMKGEAKVLLGKMEGKKGAEKVQEGKKLKAGEQ